MPGGQQRGLSQQQAAQEVRARRGELFVEEQAEELRPQGMNGKKEGKAKKNNSLDVGEKRGEKKHFWKWFDSIVVNVTASKQFQIGAKGSIVWDVPKRTAEILHHVPSRI